MSSKRSRSNCSRISAPPIWSLHDGRAAWRDQVHEDGAIREAFRTLQPRGGPKPLRVFSFLEVEDESPGERVDLVGLAGEKRK